MLRLDQQDVIVQRIQQGKQIFRSVGEVHITRVTKSRELMQRQILTHIQKQIQIQDVDPLQYGQKELRDVMSNLEEQLKTVYLSYAEESAKKFRKLFKQESKHEGEESIHQKKQRVDKNKCRICKNSTIPMILNLLNQDEQEQNQHVTMKSIRQQIVQKQHHKDQSDQKVPYIAFDYSDRIVICKRCRFKFHAECVEPIDNLNDWICDLCRVRIKELKSCNLWDYVNNKQKKQSEQKRTLMDRISKRLKVFIIEDLSSNYNRDFLRKYPLYRLENGEINYPVLEQLALPYQMILNTKTKPSPYMINSDVVEQILIIQTAQQILFPKMVTPQNVNEEQFERGFLDLLMNFMVIYHEKILSMDDFEEFDVCTSAYFQLICFIHEENQSIQILRKSWLEFLNRIQQIINFDFDDDIYDNNNLSIQDQVDLLMYLIQGLYDMDIMKKSIEQRINQKQHYVNCNAYLGQDAEESYYYYFTHVPSSIFVETDSGWGQYTLSDVPELLASLTQQGINEKNLYENIKQLNNNINLDSATPIKSSRNFQKVQFTLQMNEVIDLFIDIEDKISEYLQLKSYYWIDPSQRQNFINRLREIKSFEKLIEYLNKFMNGLIRIQCKNKKLKAFKIFQQHFDVINYLIIYAQSLTNLEGVYFSLYTLDILINQHIKLKQERKEKKLQSKRVKKSSKESVSLATRREKRENAGKNPNINYDNNEKKKIILCNKCNKAINNNLSRCNKCSKSYHIECLLPKKDVCANCYNKKRNYK